MQVFFYTGWLAKNRARAILNQWTFNKVHFGAAAAVDNEKD